MLYGGHFASGRAVEGGVDVRSFPWAGGNTTVYMAERTPGTPTSWIGSLAENMADASGQLYRRNRYYDPATGRFTQEDPIGIAGGLNLYGYGNGDPVSYTDPFGLCPYYGNRRSRNLSDCPKSMQWLTDAFHAMALNHIGLTMTDAVIERKITFGVGSCGGEAGVYACTEKNSNHIEFVQTQNGSVVTGGLVVHEVMHVLNGAANPNLSLAGHELSAWGVQLEFHRLLSQDGHAPYGDEALVSRINAYLRNPVGTMMALCEQYRCEP